MHAFDLGHLELLDVLLEEVSVTRAAARLHVSPSALSRTLGKMRDALGDELLAHQGRALALTPRGLALRDEVRRLVAHARQVLEPRAPLVPADIARVFRVRSMDYGVAVVGVPLLREVRRLAPNATLSFVQQGAEDIGAFRRAEIDVDIGVAGEPHPELAVTPLFRDHFVCAFASRVPVRKLTLAQFCARPHVIASRRAKTSVIVDELLARMGKRRHVLATASSYQEAMLLAARTDALVIVPLRLLEAHPFGLRHAPLPLATPELVVSLTWHVRNQDDAEHRWLRDLVREHASHHRG